MVVVGGGCGRGKKSEFSLSLSLSLSLLKKTTKLDKKNSKKTHLSRDGDDVEPAVHPHVFRKLDPFEHELVGLARSGAAVLVDEPPVVWCCLFFGESEF